MISEKNNLQTAQEWTKSYIDFIFLYSLICTPKNWQSSSIAFIKIMALDHSRLIRPHFLRSTSLLYKILPTNQGAWKPTFYIIYTSHLSQNSTMRHCFSHTDLGQQNAVFHNIAIQIAIIQYSGRSKHAWALAKPLKKFPKSPIRPAGSHFCSSSCDECLNEH